MPCFGVLSYKNTTKMKKIVVCLFALTVMSILLASCAHKTCDAYSSANRYQREYLR